jgi:hypothetical protein
MLTTQDCNSYSKARMNRHKTSTYLESILHTSAQQLLYIEID